MRNNISRSQGFIFDALNLFYNLQLFALGQSAIQRPRLQLVQEAHEVGLELVALLHAPLREAVPLQHPLPLPDHLAPKVFLCSRQLGGRVVHQQLLRPRQCVVARLQVVFVVVEVHYPEEEVQDLLARLVGLREDLPHLHCESVDGIAAVRGAYLDGGPEGDN